MHPFLNTRQDQQFSFLGLTTLVRASGPQTNGAFGLIEHPSMAPGFETPYHVHRKEAESFYIMSGHVAFIVDGSWLLAGPGDFLFGPRDIPHGFRVIGEAPVQMLLTCTPAGFEDFVLELSQPIDTPPGPPDMEKLGAAAARFSIDILGPLPPHPDTLLS